MSKIVIIGAGPAGLTAAYELTKNGYNVTVLEKESEVGGISKTVVFDGNRMDLGGHRFFSKDNRVNKWWEMMLPVDSCVNYDGCSESHTNNKSADKHEDCMLIRNRLSRIYYNNRFFDYPVSLKLSTILNMGVVNTCLVGCSYLSSCVHKLPENNLENFYINRFGKRLYSMFFESYTEKLWGRHPRNISAEWGAQRVKGLSITAVIRDMLSKLIPKSFSRNKKVVETSLIEHFKYPKLGPGQMWEKVAKEVEILGGNVILNAKVIELATEVSRNRHFASEKMSENVDTKLDNNSLLEKNKIISVKYKNAEGNVEEIECDYVISSMPIKDLVEKIDCEKLTEIVKIAENLPYRDFRTVGLVFDKCYFKSDKKTGKIIQDDWIYVQDAGVKLGRIQIFNNWSPFMVSNDSDVCIGLEYFCNENDEIYSMTDDAFMGMALEELKKIGMVADTISKEVIKSYHVERVDKAYPAYFDSYDEMSKLKEWINQLDNLFCIGRNGQHRYNNMDHSMVTAFETVGCINAIESGSDVSITDMKKKIWNVNTEKEYHEG